MFGIWPGCGLFLELLPNDLGEFTVTCNAVWVLALDLWLVTDSRVVPAGQYLRPTASNLRSS